MNFKRPRELKPSGGSSWLEALWCTSDWVCGFNNPLFYFSSCAGEADKHLAACLMSDAEDVSMTGAARTKGRIPSSRTLLSIPDAILGQLGQALRRGSAVLINSWSTSPKASFAPPPPPPPEVKGGSFALELTAASGDRARQLRANR